MFTEELVPHFLSGMWYEGMPGVMENANYDGVMPEDCKGWRETNL